LKCENIRLQHLVDILESQPEFIFSTTIDGNVTYISERAATQIQSASDDPEDELSHVSQILTAESIDILFESLKQLKNEKSYSVSSVKVYKIYLTF
jgi:hypothetical protein